MPSERINFPADQNGALNISWSRQSADGVDGEVRVVLHRDGALETSESLSRRGINAAIKALRKARSQAFGDE